MKLRFRFRTREAVDPEDQAVQDELQFHFDELVREYREQGLGIAEAVAAAEKRFGPLRQIARETKQEQGLRFVDWLRDDLRLLGVGIFVAPRLTMAMAILAAAIFGLSLALVQVRQSWNLLTFNDAEHRDLFWISEQTATASELSLSLPDAQVWEGPRISFSDTGIYRAAGVYAEVSGRHQRFAAAYVSSGFFRTLHPVPLVGRLFQRQEDAIGLATPSVILSERFFKSAFNGRASIVGSPIKIEGKTFLVVGVLPRDFLFPLPADLWMCLGAVGKDFQDDGYHAGFWGLGRLREAASWRGAARELENISAEMERRLPEVHRGQRLAMQKVGQRFGERVCRLLIYLLVGAQVLLALLYTVFINQIEFIDRKANPVSSDDERGGNLAVGWPMLAALLLIATGLMSFLVAENFLAQLASEELGQAFAHPFVIKELGLPILGFLLIPLVVRVVWLTNPNNWRTAFGVADSWIRIKWTGPIWSQFIKTIYIALGFALIMWAAGLILTYREIAGTESGFHGQGVDSIRLDLDAAQADLKTAIATYEELLGGVRKLKDVTAATISSRVPGEAEDFWDSAFDRGNGKTGVLPHLELTSVGSDFFRTLEIPILAGRDFNDQDRRQDFDPGNKDLAEEWIRGLGVVIVDEEIGQTIWPNQNPIGQKLNLPWGKYRLSLEVVAVVKSASFDRRNEGGHPRAYVPFNQAPRRGAAILARTTLSPQSLSDALRRELTSLHADGTLYAATTLEETPLNRLSLELFATSVLCIFSIIAWILIGVGARVDDATPRAGTRSSLLEDRLPLLWGIVLGAAAFAVAHSVFGLFFAPIGR